MANPVFKLCVPEFEESKKWIPVTVADDPITSTSQGTAEITFPANTTAADKVYTMEVYVDDVKQNITMPTVTVKASAAPVPPAFTLPEGSVTASASELPAAGGSVTMTVNVGAGVQASP